jgi:hypothetical protein
MTVLYFYLPQKLQTLFMNNNIASGISHTKHELIPDTAFKDTIVRDVVCTV